jgi:hypothetical protein
VNREFLLDKLKKSKVLEYDNDLKEAKDLEKHGFYASAFLRDWQVIESVCRELMIHYRACEEVDSISGKIFKRLAKQPIDVNVNNLKLQIRNVLYSDAKKRATHSSRNINVGIVEKVFSFFDLNHEPTIIRYLLADELKKGETLPQGIEIRKTIRKQRNSIVHKNGNMTLEEFEEIKPFIEYFYDLIYQVKEQMT